ncbi:hypothetical protein ZWY2020_057266 [Hordeum vulgare]|nr:hypothetical protein ZWY2020_057266 [Hordeum vulgare]
MDDGSSGSLAPVDGSAAPAPARKRKPGTWRRLPRVLPLDVEVRMKLGTITHEELRRQHLQRADELEKMDDSGATRRRPRSPSRNSRRSMSAEQLKHFAYLALAHYNARKAEHKFELSQALTSNCFSEACGKTYAHVNFTAKPQKSDDPTKRLFFAELMLIPELQLQEDAEPMRVLRVLIIDDAPCFGGCHEIYRKINHRMKGTMDYERCHACHDILKHPKGDMFIGGHDSTRMPYLSAT